MGIIFKLARKNLAANRGRTVFNFLCVVLSVSVISIVLGLSASILHNADFGGDAVIEAATERICIAFSAAACVMGCVTICTSFSISVRDRIRSIGFLKSVGMSAGQITAVILAEAGIYGAVGAPLGTALGLGAARLFYGFISGLLSAEQGTGIGNFKITFFTVAFSLFLGTVTVLAASLFPAVRIRRLSVLETIRDNSGINISLKQTVLSRIAEKLFGRIGLLAGQNYDNNKLKYRAFSLALSGGTTFFITVYSFFQYPVWYYGPSVEKPYAWDGVSYASYALAAYFVLVFLISSVGSVRQNIESRKKEFAVYRSIGMQNSGLRKMMSIESLFFTWYAVLFGFVGSVAGNYAVCVFYRVTGAFDMKFHYPVVVFCAFVLLDLFAGLVFAAYTRFRVARINIAETMRAG